MSRRQRSVVLGAVSGLVAATVVAVPTASSQEPEVVLTSDFEDGTTQEWFGRGSAAVEVTTDAAHGGGASLLTTGRDASWQGPGRDVRGVLQAGATYEIEAYVRLVDGSDPVTMTVQRRPAGGSDEFDTVAWQVPASSDEWVRVAGEYTFATEDNEELQLYLESPNETASYYVDDVTITMVSPPPGAAEVLVSTDFETGTTEGWGPRGPEQVAVTQDAAHGGEWSLVTTGRAETWNGPSLEITPYVEAGATYLFSAHVRLATGADPAALWLSVQTDRDGESTFENITADTEVTGDEWAELEARWTPSGAADSVHVYVESASALSDIYLDDFSLGVEPPPEVEDITPLQDVLGEHFRLGSAIDARETAGAPAELLTRHFNAVTAENHMKPEAIQPQEGVFTFGAADELVDFAEANGMQVYGHTLVWHSQTPEWFWQDENGEPLTDSPEDRQLALDRMRAHIEAIAERYGDRIWAWDVVNEAIDESQDDNLRRSPWYEIIGPDYLNYAFQFAREAFGPDVKLFLNDYNTEFPAKREAMFEVVQGLLDDDVPIDGVGHQLHLNLLRPVSLVDDTLERFRALPVEQAVTELDVSISRSSDESLPEPPADRVVQQGYYYRDLFEVLRAHDDVLSSVTTWGLHDGRSWLRTWPIERPHEAPLFFDDQLQAKPAYWGVVDPDQLPHLPRSQQVPEGTPEIDGQRELEWDLLPGTTLLAGEGDAAGTSFQVRWDAGHLSVLAEVADGTVDDGDRVELYVDDTNAKAGEYQEGDAHYVVQRDGTSSGGAATTAVSETEAGYLVEAALPLDTPGELGREAGFDIRITDAATGEQVSWSDQNHEQDVDTSRWGTLTLIEPVGHVDVPRASQAPEVDAQIEEAWDAAPAVTTDVLVEGSADGAKGEFRLLWDAERLYVLAEVDDPHLNADNSNAWEQDSVEIFVDPDNTKSGAFKPADGQYRVNYENHQSLAGDLEVIGDNLTSAARVVDGGYVVEASVELTGMDAAVGSFLGLEFQVNDATDGARTAVHTWHDPTGQSFQDTSRWGVARLVEGCDRTVEGTHLGPLAVDDGVTCLGDGARVVGPVTVQAGAGLLAEHATVTGAVTAREAAVVEVSDSRITGPVTISGSTRSVTFTGNRVTGPVRVVDNSTSAGPAVVSGNTIIGVLSCAGNEPAPTDDGEPNNVVGGKEGQCSGL